MGFWDQIDDVDLLAFAEAKVYHPLEGKTDQFPCGGAAQRNYLDSFFGTYSPVFLGFCIANTRDDLENFC